MKATIKLVLSAPHSGDFNSLKEAAKAVQYSSVGIFASDQMRIDAESVSAELLLSDEQFGKLFNHIAEIDGPNHVIKILGG